MNAWQPLIFLIEFAIDWIKSIFLRCGIASYQYGKKSTTHNTQYGGNSVPERAMQIPNKTECFNKIKCIFIYYIFLKKAKYLRYFWNETDRKTVVIESLVLMAQYCVSASVVRFSLFDRIEWRDVSRWTDPKAAKRSDPCSESRFSVRTQDSSSVADHQLFSLNTIQLQ